MNDCIEKILFSEEQINEAVKRLGKRLSEDYRGKNPLLVCILKGSVIFTADLMRSMEIPLNVDFMVVESYGQNTFSSGVIKVKKDLETDIKDRHVIIVEDILDSGITLHSLKKLLEERKPASVKIVTFLDKQVERKVDIKADYKGFDIENQFIVGYGLDYAQDYRQLPYIGILKHEVYDK